MIDYFDNKKPNRTRNLKNSSDFLFAIGCLTIVTIPLFIYTRRTRLSSSHFLLAQIQTPIINIAIFSPVLFFLIKEYTDALSCYLASFVILPCLFIILMTFVSYLSFEIRGDKVGFGMYIARDLQWTTPIGLVCNTIALITGSIQDKCTIDQSLEETEIPSGFYTLDPYISSHGGAQQKDQSPQI